ncbi:epoxide hydrolase A-like [Impatiens glandulifera]|uniref:epoxide hydrolase A-like n=1 Tax=Impatiens glandulifera TaxID=253017 RepID=UPI001FB0D8ED|nr:epoxide hydrolase A-like [Impatiens glandulifera]
MEGIQHKFVNVSGNINMHYVEMGQGPIVLFLHGFPELWYTWRHQIPFVASAGYRAVAPDLRGYGDTTGAPNDPSAFTMLHVVGDVVALLDSVAPSHKDKVFVVGHDWGAMVAWNLCLFRPDRVKAVLNMSVPFTPRNPERIPLVALRAAYGDDFYMCRFQERDEIEAEFAKIGTKVVLKNLLSYHNPSPLLIPKGKPFGDSPNETHLPPWLTEEDLNYYTTKYNNSGFTGPINYYRALNLNWELMAAWSGAHINVPTKFIIGDMDITYTTANKEYIHKGGFKRDVTFLMEVVVIKGVGHFLHEEKPDEINDHILSFLKSFSWKSISSTCSIS